MSDSTAPNPAADATILQAAGVAITGLGAVTCAGPDVESLWNAVLSGESHATWMDEPIAGRQIACCRAATPHTEGVRERDFARLDRFAQLGLTAGQQAWQDAAIDIDSVDPRRVAVISGTSRGPVGLRHDHRERKRARPTDAVFGTSSALTGSLAAWTGARGSSMTVSATCASSAVAIGIAASQIAAGTCDLALVGGADAPLHPDFVAELLATGVLGRGEDPQTVCRPFDRHRSGILIGEGAAYLVLESMSHALERGARVRATLTGWSSVCDAGLRSGISADARGIREALQSTLFSARSDTRQVSAIHLHGTGTPIGDAAEALIVRELFAERANTLPCTSTKAVTGHCLGASGALQAVINVRSLETQMLPSTLGCTAPDPECDFALVRDVPWRGPIHTILTHSAGFWGNHAGLLFARGDQSDRRMTDRKQ